MKKAFSILILSFSYCAIAAPINNTQTITTSNTIKPNDDPVQELLQHNDYLQQQQNKQLTKEDQFFSQNTQQPQNMVLEIHSFEELTYALMQAINLKHQELIQKLLEVYQADPNAEPAMIAFAKANLALNDGHLYTAIEDYQQSLQLAPFFDRAKLDLARLYFADNRLNASQKLFKEVNLPHNPNVMSKVNQYLTAIDKRESWHGNVMLGYGYTNNLNQSPKQTKTYIGNFFGEIAKITQKSPTAINTAGLKYEIALNKYHNIYNNHGIQFKAFAYGDWYRDQQKFNEHHLNLNIGYRYHNRQSDFSLSPIFERIENGGKYFEKDYGIQAKYAYDNLEKNYSIYTIEYKKERNQINDLKDYNGDSLRLAFTDIYALTANTTLYGGLVYNSKTHTKNKADQYRRYIGFLGIEKNFDIGLKLDLSANIKRTLYRGYNETFQEKRQDTEQTYSATLSIPRWEIYHFTPSIHYQYIKNKSNIDWVYSYKKNSVYLKMEMRF